MKDRRKLKNGIILSQEATAQNALLTGEGGFCTVYHCDIEEWGNFMVFKMSLFSEIHLIADKLPTSSPMISSIMLDHSSS